MGASSLAAANGKLYFGADDGIHGEEIWVSDGTETGKVMVADLVAGQGRAIPAI
jgi:ELWxxDGT repeat protein